MEIDNVLGELCQFSFILFFDFRKLNSAIFERHRLQKVKIEIDKELRLPKMEPFE